MDNFEVNVGEDEQVAERTQGLHSKENFKKLAAGTERQRDEPSEQQEVKKRKKKKKKANAGAMSFDVDEGEEEQLEAIPKKKLCNPTVNTGFLQKKEWMSADDKKALQIKEEEHRVEIMRQREEAGARPLTIVYSFTMRPAGSKGEIVIHSTDPETGEVVVNEKPPRVFKARALQTTWGTTVEAFCGAARKELQLHLIATEKTGVANMTSQNLMLVDGHMICPEGKSFMDLQACKYDDGTPIFHFGTDQTELSTADANHRAEATFNVCERHWYDDSRFHHPQSLWELFDTNQVYPNPAKTMRRKVAGSQDFADQYAKAKGGEELFIYEDTEKRVGYGGHE